MNHTKNKPLPTSPYQGRSKSGFTLVELIVTITIIAILGAIAFTAFNGFQSSARDSSRASDLANLSQALDTSYIKSGSYPNPDNAFTVTYSGGSLWYQGTVGDTLINTLSSNGSKLSKKPTDPLTTTREYAYSKSAYGNTYELSSNWEGDRIAYTNHLSRTLAYSLQPHLITQAQAASGNPLITYIKGNYNGMVAKTVTGSTVYVIATPSLTTSTGSANTSIDVTTLSGKLLYHGQTNSGGIAYTPTLIYSSGSLPTNDTTGQITLLTTNLQTAYSGSVISSNSNIQNVLTTTGATNITSLGVSIITNYLGGSASVPPPPPATSYSLTNSLMFDSAGSQYLSKSFTTAGNTKKWTWSGWVKVMPGKQTNLFWVGDVGTNDTLLYISPSTGAMIFLNRTAGVTDGAKTTSALFRDPSSWYHIIFSWDSTNSTPGDRIRLYVNNIRQTSFTTNSDPSSGADSHFNKIAEHRIGNYSTGYNDGYLADVNFVDSGALDPTSFGQFDPTTNQWLPKQYTGTYGTNGFHLDFSSGATTASLGIDSSGNGNYWTPTGTIVPTPTLNQVIDTPLNNFATLNPIDRISTESGSLFSVGNSKWQSVTGVNGKYSARSTIAVNSGKWYFETKVTTVGSTDDNLTIGIQTDDEQLRTITNRSLDIGYYRNSGYELVQNRNPPWVVNDIVGVAVDIDADTITFTLNGSPFVTKTAQELTGKVWRPFITNSITNGRAGFAASVNFGQRPFTNPIPTGFKSLSTANLPDPAIQNPKQYFDVLTYTGTSANQTITGLGFQPDFVWIKGRNAAWNNVLRDSVRGATKFLYSNTGSSEATAGAGYSFDSSGFSIGTSAEVNSNTNTYVAWNWKKGTTPGFDVVTYTGTAANTTIAHSLNAVPKMIIVKSRTGNRSWGVYHASVGNSGALYLDLTNATNVASFHWNNTSPTSSTFSLGVGTVTNSAEPYIAYLWSEVPGFSKFGSYTGNGSATDGPFVYTGFRPAYILVKQVDTANGWGIFDSKRISSNPVINPLQSNTASTELSGYDFDFTSNGFKLKHLAGYNVSGGTYIYAAFAEAPFKYANAR